MSPRLQTVLLVTFITLSGRELAGWAAWAERAPPIPEAERRVSQTTFSTLSRSGPTLGPVFEQAPTPSNVTPQAAWPSPVNDQDKHLFTLFNVLEYRPRTGAGQEHSYRWDVTGWYGGDFNRLWFKSEGHQDTAFKAHYDVDVQLLYGRLISPYFDFQIGGRLETQRFRGRNVTRSLGVIGLQGLVPYSYDIDPALFVDDKGNVSARLTAFKELLFTQRLILQLRFETNLAIQRVEEFTTGTGLNNVEFGLRLRYEIRRKFAPYVGVSAERSFGETAALVRDEGGSPSQVRFVIGVRLWF